MQEEGKEEEYLGGILKREPTKVDMLGLISTIAGLLILFVGLLAAKVAVDDSKEAKEKF